MQRAGSSAPANGGFSRRSDEVDCTRGLGHVLESEERLRRGRLHRHIVLSAIRHRPRKICTRISTSAPGSPHREPFPRRDQIEPAMLGVDWLNCLVIAVKSPVRLSTFVYVGENLSFTRCPDESLAGVLLSHLPQVLSERRCLMIEGLTRFRDLDILYRNALYPLSEDGIAIDHVLGAANYRPL